MTNTPDRQAIKQSVLNMFLLKFERFYLHNENSSGEKQTFPSRLRRAALYRMRLAQFTLYRYIFYFAKDRKTIISNYWGREDGFKHAKTMFERQETSWLGSFATFYKTLQHFLEEHKDHQTNILELVH